MSVSEYEVTLSISPEAYQRFYRGTARSVVANDRHGNRISFPAEALRPFVTHGGITGTFVIRVDGANKLLDIQRKQV